MVFFLAVLSSVATHRLCIVACRLSPAAMSRVYSLAAVPGVLIEMTSLVSDHGL